MIKVHTSPNAVEIHNLKNVLEGSGIECEIRGESIGGQFDKCWKCQGDRPANVRDD